LLGSIQFLTDKVTKNANAGYAAHHDWENQNLEFASTWHGIAKPTRRIFLAFFWFKCHAHPSPQQKVRHRKHLRCETRWFPIRKIFKPAKGTKKLNAP
jgi:hypothetical protein